MKLAKHKYWLIASYALVTFLVIFSARNFFYWDTVQLAAKHANFYYDTSFSSILLPQNLDSGHIPAFGYYIALVWSVFGKSLVSSHLAMLPFALGIVYQLHRLVTYFVNSKYTGPAILIVLVDATLLAQMLLVSPDVPLVFFFLAAFNAVIRNKKLIYVLCLLGLFLVSMRGMMVALCLLLLDIYQNIELNVSYSKKFQNLLKRSVLYLPALFVFLGYSYYHYSVKGWIGFHEDSPWAGSFEGVDFKGFMFNIAIYIWRILDFGRIGVWMILLIIWFFGNRMLRRDSKTRMLIFFAGVLMILLPMNMLWAKGLLSHRYLLPIFLVVSLLCVRLLFSNHVPNKNREPMAYLLFFILLAGNLWIYPPKIAQGWDASLAHIPYYGLREKAMDHIEKNDIPMSETASFFPNSAKLRDIDLIDSDANFDEFEGNEPYVFYSNTFNISDEQLNILASDYVVLERFERSRVYVIIYQRKSSD